MSEKALALDPGLAEAHASRGAALSALERYAEAATEFEKAIRLDPNSYEALTSTLALASSRVSSNRHALFERSSEVKPDDYASVCILVQFYNSLGRKQDAKEAARKGAKLAERQFTLHPDDAKAAELGSGSLIEIGEFDRAREWIARALSIEPDNPVTHYNAACGYPCWEIWIRPSNYFNAVCSSAARNGADGSSTTLRLIRCGAILVTRRSLRQFAARKREKFLKATMLIETHAHFDYLSCRVGAPPPPPPPPPPPNYDAHRNPRSSRLPRFRERLRGCPA